MGRRARIATSVASALAFNFFHIEPTGRFTIAEGENWVALAVFLVAAVIAASVAEAARVRAAEAEQRGREADLAAELARVLLGAPDLPGALAPAAQRIAQAFGLASCRVALGAVGGRRADRRGAAVTRRRAAGHAARPGRRTPRRRRDAPGARGAARRRARPRPTRPRGGRDACAASLGRDQDRGPARGVARPPLPADRDHAGAEALGSPSLSEEERTELAAGVTRESARLARVVDKLIELSRLQAGSAAPRRDWTSVEEVLREAVDDAGLSADRVRLAVDRDLPLILADAAQLERAFANLLENAGAARRRRADLRAGAGERGAAARARRRPRAGHRARRPRADLRAFLPRRRGQRGSGLGLAIVKGFVEANGGHVHVESLPGQGASFVVALPLPEPVAV